ncbi:hypothetical protein Pcinc_001376 [Petrolisthes cinctipes]|uniref:RNA-directed DNA polymerase n=1 Tax=Petrolisthes cinctipes TaxID=88211 RepID=A0AAE1L607_PETCI|nr:hypothetical protein Pcinc_001376 [Petrolisthes cinctipes]
MEPDPNKISGIVNMPAPGDLTHLRGFLCTVNFLARYLPKLATVSEPLRQLLKKNVPYVWSDAHEKSFNAVKELVTRAPILRYYDPRIDVVLQCDASQYGLGAALIQDGKPVAYASRAMTSTEKNYAQIEKELLAIVFATQRFDQYIYGLSADEVHTDHKPLEAILRKSINDSANRRIQRMLLRLQRYNLCVKYVPGRELWIADTLSRQLPCPTVKPGAFAINLAEHELAIDLAVTAECLQEYRTTSSQDSELQAVVVAIRSGDWSMPAVAEYTPVKSELSTDGVLVFKGARLVVPRTLRSRVLQQLHAAHMGIEATRRRARESVFWPGLNGHIKDMVSRCSTCAAVQPSQAREPMLSHEVPVVPWTKVGMDFFEWNRQKYLVITDYTSNWFEVKELKSTSASSLVRECRVQFARHGVPLQIVADSGTQFLSRTFHKFAEEWNFEVVTSSPYHHQSNGKAENAVHTIKKLLSKSEMSNTDPLLAILEWRNTPSEATGTSPAQKLFGRRCRTPLPVSTGLLMPVVEDTKGMVQKAKEKQVQYYNRGTKLLPDLQEGQPVMLQVPGSTRWMSGTVMETLPHRSYVVQSGGHSYRRNRRYLRRRVTQDEEPSQSYHMGNDGDSGSLQTPVRSAITKDASSPTAVSRPVKPPRRLDFAPRHSHQTEEQQQQQQQKRTHSPPPLLPRRSTRESRPPERYVPQR